MEIMLFVGQWLTQKLFGVFGKTASAKVLNIGSIAITVVIIFVVLISVSRIFNACSGTNIPNVNLESLSNADDARQKAAQHQVEIQKLQVEREVLETKLAEATKEREAAFEKARELEAKPLSNVTGEELDRLAKDR